MYSGLKVHFDDATSHQKLYLLVVYCWKCIIDGKNADITDKFIYLSGVCNFAHWRDDVKCLTYDIPDQCVWECKLVTGHGGYDRVTGLVRTVDGLVETVWQCDQCDHPPPPLSYSRSSLHLTHLTHCLITPPPHNTAYNITTTLVTTDNHLNHDLHETVIKIMTCRTPTCPYYIFVRHPFPRTVSRWKKVK